MVTLLTWKFKQIFLTLFNQKFLRPISNCDSLPVRLNSLNDLEEIVLLLCNDKSLTAGSFCQLFTDSDFENIGVFAGGIVNWLQL